MPVMFPEHIAHSQIRMEQSTPISAGFCIIEQGEVKTVYGRSESLNLSTNERDKDLLQKSILIMGVATSLFLDL
jgi:hypothetical protein